jgi:hypothetical protein
VLRDPEKFDFSFSKISGSLGTVELNLMRPVPAPVLSSIRRQQLVAHASASEQEMSRNMERDGKKSDIAILLVLIIVLNSFQLGVGAAQ